ncbi:MAG: hypothetical protein JSR99_09315 [Proteobacteria bacterium]|nr:hypothetical protein [Pseudomonadota bacterium]
MTFIPISNDRFLRQTEARLDRSVSSAAVSRSRIAQPAAAFDYSVHPAPILIALGCCAWFLLLSWTCFAPFDREAGLAIAVVTAIFAMYLGGMTLGAFNAAGQQSARRQRSFHQFLRGRVDIATGFISGREAMVQIVMLPVSLAFGATAMALIWVAVQ